MIARKILVYGKIIGRPKKKSIELIANDIKTKILVAVDLQNKTHVEKDNKNRLILASRANTKSPKLKEHMKDGKLCFMIFFGNLVYFSQKQRL